MGKRLGIHEVVEVGDMFFVPVCIRMFGSDFVLYFVVADDALFFRIDEEHLTRFEAPFIKDVFGWDSDNADFRTDDDPVVAGNIVAPRPQAISVEHAADDRAVAEADAAGPSQGSSMKLW